MSKREIPETMHDALKILKGGDPSLEEETAPVEKQQSPPVVPQNGNIVFVDYISKLNVHAEPSRSSETIFVLRKGMKVVVDGETKDLNETISFTWLHIHLPGHEDKTGYILANYVRED